MSDADDPKQPAAAAPGGTGPSSDSDSVQGAALAEESQEPRACTPCHGSGKVISNLGGNTTTVTCPWCRGGGERLTDMDAQEFQREQAALKPAEP
jgi:hypothetical protein